MTTLIAFESSADETSVAVVKDGNQVLSNAVATQINSHQRFGGIVPEVASRHHLEWITKTLDIALDESGVNPDELDGVAVTYGPGLVGSLLVGLMGAKTFAMAHNLPLIPVNHLAGHIAAANFNKAIEYPAIALMVSGGHTELVLMEKENSFEILGETYDDAAGESYDKVGRLMGLNYPAGKAIDELADQGEVTIDFPQAMAHEAGYDFSFSGLKSAVINQVHNAEQRGDVIDQKDLAASFQAAVIKALIDRTRRALQDFPVRSLVLAGGVAANSGLRHALAELMTEFPDTDFIPVPKQYTGDNAAMIGAAGYWNYKQGIFADLDLNTHPGLDFPLREKKTD
ncbi:tRNA (adenosine(37)-N6)-threonylcarbamoyltransferase complex transferase subunit TsaD [Fructobacillus fructosus]|uniref:tRNA N6-adenosine threonylcarbamoyltransferase n=1 Tax=Fructobacillus fructosus TaxID=1631 RepID=A0ABM9MZ49_9LACO|nr:tRNA (adenosine(37)-N6)-threonylcarbamoyltransferase complex transferase subunit TsaD [Fructobacillus fructosus]MBD9366373.1 tRNA (adenosine(37)-N6)-threonylcarbamoyltransferase complex transferase subunit TsaD [Leuconostoc mesenteroides]KRN52342.1 UGMP family protein [Fructobacillus fructosus KCTC 3544]MBC9119176.1 tRNA (adenosine(37)-N6)-threonylcarbamoyltransferase complex transferase subunit TsaD [Fructobacillus fructosus]MCK8638805.1 tRNA (adenosine(37)-N6)-threonylcarbamoyltransferase 